MNDNTDVPTTSSKRMITWLRPKRTPTKGGAEGAAHVTHKGVYSGYQYIITPCGEQGYSARRRNRNGGVRQLGCAQRMAEAKLLCEAHANSV